MAVEAVVGVRVGAVGWGEVKEEVGGMAGVVVGKVGEVGLPQEQRCHLVSPATDITHNQVRPGCTNEAQLITQPCSARKFTDTQMKMIRPCAHGNTNLASKAMSMTMKGKHMRMQS